MREVFTEAHKHDGSIFALVLRTWGPTERQDSLTSEVPPLIYTFRVYHNIYQGRSSNRVFFLRWRELASCKSSKIGINLIV